MTEPSELMKQTSAVAAVLVVSDIHQSAEFYQQKLGCQIEEIWGDPPGFAVANMPRGAIMLKQGVDASSPGVPQPNHKQVGALWDAYVWANNIDALIKDFVARGTPMSKPVETVYGCTEIEVTDPDGHIICFGYCP